MLPLMSAAELLPQGVFPPQPVPMTEGYGVNGAGTHFGVPIGYPNGECIVNPVSFKQSSIETTVTKVVAGDAISIPTTILFDFDGDIVLPTGTEHLRNVITMLTTAGVTELSVVGHTDARGTEEYNQGLGLRRAQAVALVLSTLGFDKITAGSAGETEPLSPNDLEDGSDNPEGRQDNRRVVIIVTSVADVEIDETFIVVADRNPQVFHVLSSDNSVACGNDNQDHRALLFHRHGSYSGSGYYYDRINRPLYGR